MFSISNLEVKKTLTCEDKAKTLSQMRDCSLSQSHGYNEGAWEMGQLSVSSPSIPLSLAGCQMRQIPQYLSCVNCVLKPGRQPVGVFPVCLTQSVMYTLNFLHLQSF